MSGTSAVSLIAVAVFSALHLQGCIPIPGTKKWEQPQEGSEKWKEGEAAATKIYECQEKPEICEKKNCEKCTKKEFDKCDAQKKNAEKLDQCCDCEEVQQALQEELKNKKEETAKKDKKVKQQKKGAKKKKKKKKSLLETTEEDSADGMSADETSADETSADETSADETSAEGTPAEGTPAEGTPAEGLSAAGTSADGLSAAGTSDDEMAVDGMSPQEEFEEQKLAALERRSALKFSELEIDSTGLVESIIDPDLPVSAPAKSGMAQASRTRADPPTNQREYHPVRVHGHEMPRFS